MQIEFESFKKKLCCSDLDALPLKNAIETYSQCGSAWLCWLSLCQLDKS